MSNMGKPLTRRKAADIGLCAESIPPGVLETLEVLQGAGFDAYIVGGGVRDILLGSKPVDFDLATSASPEQVRKLFRRCRLIGRRFRLAHVRHGRSCIEVSTFRAAVDAGDVQSGDKRAIQRLNNTYGTMHEDAYRRDFIANSIYYDPHAGEVHMHEKTLEDIRARRLTVIGDPERRFKEDPVRMLRAVRLATRLDMEIEAKTRKAIPRLGGLLRDEPPARLFDAFTKLFHAGVARAVFDELRALGLFAVLFPLTERHLPPPGGADDDGEDAQYLDFLYALLGNTDQRLSIGKPVVPAFILAAFLWAEVEERSTQALANGEPAYTAVGEACRGVFGEQSAVVAISKPVAMMIVDICRMQRQFKETRARVLHGLSEQRKFRAAFDFMCLRSKVGLEEPELCDWWERYQTFDKSRQRQMINERVRSRRHA